jgi:hypothetical protein
MPLVCRHGISGITFHDHEFRGDQIELATPIPEEVGALLMASFNDVLARPSSQVANYGCFNVYLALHGFSPGSNSIVAALEDCKVATPVVNRF